MPHGFQRNDFEWDDEKAQRNRQRHAVTFEEATSAFDDGLAIHLPDHDHSEGEPRFRLLGYSYARRLLVVSYTERAGRTRIISARSATRTERRAFMAGEISEGMQEEYDFSKGTRGKFAGRFGPGTDRSWVLRAARADVAEWHRAAFEAAQELDDWLVTYLALDSKRASDAEGNALRRRLAHLLEDPESPERSRLLADYANRKPSAGSPRHLEPLLGEREWLVHRSLREKQEDTLEGCAERAERLRRLTDGLNATLREIRRVLADRFEREGLSEEDLEEKRSAAVRACWTAA
jgi:uncharacterized DUF497 family protein